ncbi:MAG TPA: hypothetical protein DFR83_00765 [Deltaproteobacteria bacterium]|nr:hypothetical protein [Deltaproteobacteria bacterium]
MPLFWLALFTAPPAHARPPHICAADLSTLPLEPMGLIEPPVRLEEHAVRPGLLRAQADICRCTPRRPRHRPSAVLARLHISPSAGTVRVAYTFDAPDGSPRAAERMRRCLGMPTLTVEPLPYRSDMLVDGEPIDEVLVYPLKLVLTE